MRKLSEQFIEFERFDVKTHGHLIIPLVKQYGELVALEATQEVYKEALISYQEALIENDYPIYHTVINATIDKIKELQIQLETKFKSFTKFKSYKS